MSCASDDGGQPMRFVVEIHLGGDAMRTAADVADALGHVMSALRLTLDGPIHRERDAVAVRMLDRHGKPVGTWSVEPRAVAS